MSITHKKSSEKALPLWREWLSLAVTLFKLRVVSLLLMSAVGGAFLGAGGWPPLQELLILLATGLSSAAGASALNQYLERERDKEMSRTKKRPLPMNTINQAWVPIVGVLLILIPVLAVLPSNPALAFFLFLGAFIYVVIYTIWLKPRTLLNIVIGGAAGSAAVMSGGAAVGAWQDSGVIVLALILFLWTPCHFWSLAMVYRDDYAGVDVPMLPTQVSPQRAAWWVLSHTLPTALGSVLLAVRPTLGLVYFIPVFLVSAEMIRRNIMLIRQPNRTNALVLFITSNYYLLVVLLAICLSVII